MPLKSIPPACVERFSVPCSAPTTTSPPAPVLRTPLLCSEDVAEEVANPPWRRRMTNEKQSYESHLSSLRDTRVFAAGSTSLLQLESGASGLLGPGTPSNLFSL